MNGSTFSSQRLHLSDENISKSYWFEVGMFCRMKPKISFEMRRSYRKLNRQILYNTNINRQHHSLEPECHTLIGIKQWSIVRKTFWMKSDYMVRNHCSSVNTIQFILKDRDKKSCKAWDRGRGWSTKPRKKLHVLSLSRAIAALMRESSPISVSYTPNHKLVS